MVDCSKLFGKRTFVNYQEFSLALAMAVECGRHGKKLNMSMMTVADPAMLSDLDKSYLKYLKAVGEIYDGSVPKETFERFSVDDLVTMRPAQWFDPRELDGKTDLFEEAVDCYRWSTEWAMREKSSVATSPMMLKIRLGNTILHLVAHFLVCKELGIYHDKPLVLSFVEQEVRSTYLYLTIYACTQSCAKLAHDIKLDFKDNKKELRDLSYFVLYEQCRNAGRFCYHSPEKKVEVLRKLGWKKGEVFVLYLRGKMSTSNPAGNIKEATIIVALNDLYDDTLAVEFLAIPVNKTAEEKELDYIVIDEEYRYLFSDMQVVRMHCERKSLELNNLGVLTYFNYEEYLLEPLDKCFTVKKRITIDGIMQDVEMNTVEAVYWILNEFGVLRAFERKLYSERYNNGRPLLWDTCNGTPDLKAVRLESVNRYSYE